MSFQSSIIIAIGSIEDNIASLVVYQRENVWREVLHSRAMVSFDGVVSGYESSWPTFWIAVSWVRP